MDNQTVANRNNNPGNIKDVSTGEFKVYSTPQEGYAALLNDLETKKSGKSKTGLTSDSTLADFSKAYAPASDKNDPARYTVNLANHMGVRPDTKISDLDVGKWAEAIASAEGYQGQSSPSSAQPDRKTFSESLPPAPIQHSGPLGTNPTDSLYGKLIDNSVTRGIMNVGNALSFGGAKQLGTQAGIGMAALPAATKDLFTGGNESQFYERPSFGETAKGAAKTVAGVGLLASSSLLGDFFKSGGALKSPEVIKILEGSVGNGETVADLTRQEAINTLGNTLKEMSTSDVGGKTEQLILKALQQLNPTIIEKQSLLMNLLKGGVNLASKAALLKILGDTVGGLVHQNTKL